MPLKNLLSLHEAIVIALINQPNRTAGFEQIATFIEERSLYTERKGNISLAIQVMLRSTKAKGAYHHLFEQVDTNTIRLKNLEPAALQQLKEENEALLALLAKMKRSHAINDILLGFHESNFASAAADLLINPNPIKIHGTEKGKGYDVMAGLQDIVLIESKGRVKKIYLKQHLLPVEGGFKRNTIETNENFESLLKRIQGNGHHILRVSESYAVNIYHYELLAQNSFVLIIPPPGGFDPALKKIVTDKKFDTGLYHQRLMEIDRLSRHHQDFAVNLKKTEEINRYKNP